MGVLANQTLQTVSRCQQAVKTASSAGMTARHIRYRPARKSDNTGHEAHVCIELQGATAVSYRGRRDG